VFSIYNASRRAVDNPCMSQRQLTWLAKQFGIEKDDTLIVLVRRGEKDEAETQRRKISRLQQVGPLSGRRGQSLRRVLRMRTLARGRSAYCAPMAGRP